MVPDRALKIVRVMRMSSNLISAIVNAVFFVKAGICYGVEFRSRDAPLSYRCSTSIKIQREVLYLGVYYIPRWPYCIPSVRKLCGPPFDRGSDHAEGVYSLSS